MGPCVGSAGDPDDVCSGLCTDGLCECPGGLFIPAANGLPQVAFVLIYLLLLIWCFLGVAVIADIFMSAIETITSKEKRVKLQVEGMDGEGTIEKYFHVKVWNETIANLTLMALGSSAPEILLSVFEIVVVNNFWSGELGPSTIVGSAAFNLFVIIGVCVLTIPDGEIRRIKDMGVFTTTAIFSVFAYLWLVFVLVVLTPNIVDIGEGILTFLFFPVLVGIAYSADKGKCCFGQLRQGQMRVVAITGADGKPLGKDEVAQMMAAVRRKHGEGLSESQVAKLVAMEAQAQAPKSRAYYRVQAGREMTGGRRVSVRPGKDDVELYSEADMEKGDNFKDKSFKSKHQQIYFERVVEAVEEGKAVKMKVIRACTFTPPDVDCACSVNYATVEGTATSGADFTPIQGTLEFANGETEKYLEVQTITDDEPEEDEFFKVVLSDATGATLGRNHTLLVTILDEGPGILSFPEDSAEVLESAERIVIPVLRRKGTTGKITCKYHTKNGTAVTPHDYIATSGELVFEHGEDQKDIEVTVINDDEYEKDERFQLIIHEATGGATFDKTTDGFDTKCIVTITIKSDDDVKKMVDRLLPLLNITKHQMQLGTDSWVGQFKEACLVNGGEGANSPLDYVSHALSMPWKLIFAFCPPASMWGGWACFYAALGFIALETIIVGDIAAIMGCAMGITPSVTAITFVALGTSLPDLFASKTAAVQDVHSDAAIGNVTGSNSVNVFLGLGMPWVAATIYWSSVPEFGQVLVNDGSLSTRALEWHGRYINPLSCGTQCLPQDTPLGFAVPAGDLGFSVIVFSLCAITALCTLVLRRKKLGGELGGPSGPKKITCVFFIFLWLIYVIMSVLQENFKLVNF